MCTRAEENTLIIVHIDRRRVQRLYQEEIVKKNWPVNEWPEYLKGQYEEEAVQFKVMAQF